MSSPFSLRLITTNDAAAVLDVYKPYVESTAITFEYEVPSIEEFEFRIQANTQEYPWLVCECDGKIVGYAYGSRHRSKAAYQWSPETTIYFDTAFHGKGVAKIVYETLLELMKFQGYVNAFAGIAMPNVKSESFHKYLGFTEIGTFKNIGFKLGAWHDVKWLQLDLSDHTASPEKPILMDELKENKQFNAIIQKANARFVQ